MLVYSIYRCIVEGVCFGLSSWSNPLNGAAVCLQRSSRRLRESRGRRRKMGDKKKNERKGKGVKREKTAHYKSEWKQEWKWVLTIYKAKQTRGIRKGPRGTGKAINEKRRRKRVWNNTWILHFEREKQGGAWKNWEIWENKKWGE